MKKKIDSVLKEVLEKVKPSKEELKEIKERMNEFLKEINKNIKRERINAEVFIGGSFAKDTIIKKDHYDIDVFLRFLKYEDEKLSGITEKLLKGFKFERIHGSRDYFKIKIKEDVYIELVPVRKIKKPKEAYNITDLSYSHVKYIRGKVKSEKIRDDIRIAKAFCYANECYGAESYIKGFSGYALELLIYYYKGFLRFAKEAVKAKDKIIIDIEKHYKNKNDILIDLNSAKLKSPIILIDPTYKQRNALAALSEETFEKFKKSCKEFLENPSEKHFEVKRQDFFKAKTQAEKNKNEFIMIEAFTDKQPGDIAGSKLLKFYKHLDEELERLFIIRDKGFEYNKGNSARFFFSAKQKGEILIKGPEIKDKKNVLRFKKKHKKCFIIKGRIYAKEKSGKDIKGFVSSWKNKNLDKINDMGIVGLEVRG